MIDAIGAEPEIQKNTMKRTYTRRPRVEPTSQMKAVNGFVEKSATDNRFADKVETAPNSSVLPKRSIRRRSHRAGNEDKFFIPPEIIPDGYSVEWKRMETLGKGDDFYLMGLEEQGWQPATIDMGKLGQIVPAEYKQKTIVRDGLMLYIRPIELTKEARQEDLEIARAQVSDRFSQLGLTPNGQAPRQVTALKREYERIPVDE